MAKVTLFQMRNREKVKSRSLLCFWAIRELGMLLIGHIKDMEHNMERIPEDSDREYRIHDEAVVDAYGEKEGEEVEIQGMAPEDECMKDIFIEINWQGRQLAVIAHIRHTETKYDELLAKGYERWEAREQVMGKVDRIINRWETADSSHQLE
jgi:hypothetical protein